MDLDFLVRGRILVGRFPSLPSRLLSPASPSESDNPKVASCTRFSLRQMEQATDGWAEDRHVGSGAYGDVYRGADPSIPAVQWAVKRARLLSNEFRKEVSEQVSECVSE